MTVITVVQFCRNLQSGSILFYFIASIAIKHNTIFYSCPSLFYFISSHRTCARALTRHVQHSVTLGTDNRRSHVRVLQCAIVARRRRAQPLQVSTRRACHCRQQMTTPCPAVCAWITNCLSQLASHRVRLHHQIMDWSKSSCTWR